MSHEQGKCNSSYFDTHQVIKLMAIIPNDNNYEIIMIIIIKPLGCSGQLSVSMYKSLSPLFTIPSCE